MSDIHSFEPIWPQWKIDEQSGCGACGDVWSATFTDPVTGATRRAAIKHIQIPGEGENEELNGFPIDQLREHYCGQMNMLMREINAAAQLRGCPNIVNYEDCRIIPRRDSIGYDLFLRMELLTPLPALQRQQNNTMTCEQVLKLGLDIAGALNALQKRGMIHLDIKPSNILMDGSGNFKLGDCGIARVLIGLPAASTHDVMPSHYMAPEICFGAGQYDQTADIYSLGIILYSCMNNNCLPFVTAGAPGRNAFERRIRGQSFPPPAQADPQLANVIMRSVAYRPEQRYQTAAQLLSALQACTPSGHDGQPIMTYPHQQQTPAIQQPAQSKPAPDPSSSPKDRKGGHKKLLPLILVSVTAALVIILVAQLLLRPAPVPTETPSSAGITESEPAVTGIP